MEPQTRRLAQPNRIRYPTDCLFASSCSPLHFTMTELLSATALWHTPTGTHPVDKLPLWAHDSGIPCRNDEDTIYAISIK